MARKRPGCRDSMIRWAKIGLDQTQRRESYDIHARTTPQCRGYLEKAKKHFKGALKSRAKSDEVSKNVAFGWEQYGKYEECVWHSSKKRL